MKFKTILPLVAIVLTGSMIACNQPGNSIQDQGENTSVTSLGKTESKNEPSVQLSLAGSNFNKNGKIAVTVTVYTPPEAPPAPAGTKVAPRPDKEEITLQLFPTAGIELKENIHEFKLKPGTSKTLNLNAQAIRAGYASISVLASSQIWGESVTAMIGFDVAYPDQKGKYANRMNKSGIRKLEDYLANVPEQSDELLNDQARANLENRDDVPQVYTMTNARFPTKDGTLSEPISGIVYRMTGATGKPTPGELDKPKPKLASSGLKAKASCGGFINSTTFKISKSGTTWPLQRKKINIYDENPWLPSTLIFSGFTDDNGSVSYWQPYCDMGTFWDTTKPDIYYEINSADSAGVEVLNIFTPLALQYTVRTPTYWDASQPGTVYIDGVASSQGQALWVTQLATKALAFNEAGGLNGSSRFPVRIAWPSRDPYFLFGLLGTSHAHVAKIELKGADWTNELTVWHEFGHELLYRTANVTAYEYAYNSGPFYSAVPNFHWGSHDLVSQQIYDLAFNEGWAAYFANTMYVNEFTSSPYDYVFYSCIWYCTYNGSVVWNVGGENETRVATFLSRYTRNVLQVWPSSPAVTLPQAFAKIRASMWGMGSYMRDLHDVWKYYIRNNQPPTKTITGLWSDSFIKTHNIATETYMDLSRLPGNP